MLVGMARQLVVGNSVFCELRDYGIVVMVVVRFIMIAISLLLGVHRLLLCPSLI